MMNKMEKHLEFLGAACFHFALVVWLHVTEIYIYNYIYNDDAAVV